MKKILLALLLVSSIAGAQDNGKNVVMVVDFDDRGDSSIIPGYETLDQCQKQAYSLIVQMKTKKKWATQTTASCYDLSQ